MKDYTLVRTLPWYPGPLEVSSKYQYDLQWRNPMLSLKEPGKLFYNYFSQSKKDHFIFLEEQLPSHGSAVAPKVRLFTRVSSASISLSSALPLQSWLRQMRKALTLDVPYILNVLLNKCLKAESPFVVATNAFFPITELQAKSCSLKKGRRK